MAGKIYWVELGGERKKQRKNRTDRAKEQTFNHPEVVRIILPR